MGLYLEQVDRVLAAIKTASDSPALPNDINDFNDQSQVHGVTLAENIREHFEERAAIREHDGGEPREKAEAEARKSMRVYEFKLSDNPSVWLTYLAPGVGLSEAEQSLRLRYPERLISVREHKYRTTRDRLFQV